MTSYITTQQLFTGEEWIQNCKMLIEDGYIIAIEPYSAEPEHEMIVPAFIDLQVYGAGGRLLSAYPEVASLQALHDACISEGTHYFLPTVATNSPEVISQCIKAVRDYWEQGGQGCLGLHLEGPWLNPVRRGAHLEQFMHSPTKDEVLSLLAEGRDIIKMITLAPECCADEIVEILLANNILLSAGHSDATYDQAIEGFGKGIRLATHLFNAMSPFQHRAPGLAGAILDHPSAMCSIIPDGLHVNWVAVKLAYKLMKERLFVITDAVTDTDIGPYKHRLAKDYYEADGVLSGSALSMLKACNNLICYAGLDKTEALRLCAYNPARAFGMQDKLGCLKIGYKASYVSVQEKDNQFVLNKKCDVRCL